jgi:hypothetical protein
VWTQNKRVPPLVPSRETQSSSVNTDIALKQEKRTDRKTKQLTPLSYFFTDVRCWTFELTKSQSQVCFVLLLGLLGVGISVFSVLLRGKGKKFVIWIRHFGFLSFSSADFKKKGLPISHSSVNWMWQISLSLLNLEKSRQVRRFARGKLKHSTVATCWLDYFTSIILRVTSAAQTNELQKIEEWHFVFLFDTLGYFPFVIYGELIASLCIYSVSLADFYWLMDVSGT